MNSIISPWVFYWIDVCDALKRLMWCGVLTGVFVMFISCLCDDDGNMVFKQYERAMKKVGLFIAALCLICGIFIPSEDTCYKMLAAKMLTADNINSATEYVTDVVDYAVDKIKELNPVQDTEE